MQQPQYVSYLFVFFWEVGRLDNPRWALVPGRPRERRGPASKQQAGHLEEEEEEEKEEEEEEQQAGHLEKEEEGQGLVWLGCCWARGR